MAQPSLVSCIVPCYNAAPWLAQTLESAFAQTWPRCEIILVDDGSTDESLAIACRYESRGLRIFTQPNRGASAARNAGLRAAQGEFIQFLDADDLLTADKIAAQVACLEEKGGDCLASCRWGRFDRDPAEAVFSDQAVFRDFLPVEFLLLHTAENRMIHPAAWLAPRVLLDQAGPWDESLTLNDDGEYFARVALRARRIVYAAAGASLYRSNLHQSLSRRRDRRALESLAHSVELIAAHLQKAEGSPRVRQALADYWQRLAYDAYPVAPDISRRANAEARRLGGSRLKPSMGTRQQWLAKLIGWKLSRRLQNFFSS